MINRNSRLNGTLGLAILGVLILIFCWSNSWPVSAQRVEPALGVYTVIQNLGRLYRNSFVEDVALIDDGRMIFLQSLESNYGVEPMLSRRKANGALDTTFGEQGYVIQAPLKDDLPYWQNTNSYTQLLIGRDKSIFGYGDGMIKYHADGTLDMSYGLNGRVLPSTPNSFFDSSHLVDAVMLSDGEIVALPQNMSCTCIRSWWVTPQGQFDARRTTDENGTYHVGLNTRWFSDSISVNKIFVQPNDAVLFVGSSRNLQNDDDHKIFLMRVRSDGIPDNSFGINGVITFTPFITASTFAPKWNISRIRQDSKQNILIAGVMHDSYQTQGEFVLRLNSDGSLDKTFANTGVLFKPVKADYPPDRTDIFDLFVNSADKILLQEQEYDGGIKPVYTLTRLSSAGTLDISFGKSGFITHTLGAIKWYQPDGAMFFTERKFDEAEVPFGPYSSTDVSYLVLRKFAASGLQDLAFGENGSLTLRAETSSDDHIEQYALLPNGAYYVAGTQRYSTSKGALFVSRYLADDTLDSAFASSGVFTSGVILSSTAVKAILPLSDGTLLVAGQNKDEGWVAHLDANGKWVSKFGNSGVARFPAHPIESINVLSDGKILVSQANGFAITRLNRDATVDYSFGVNGVVTRTFSEVTSIYKNGNSSSQVTGHANKILLNPDGSFWVGATATWYRLGSSGEEQAVMLMRYSANGIADESLGVNGVYTVANGSTLYPPRLQIDMQFDADRKILIAFNTSVFGNIATLFRFDQQGNPDLTFGKDGKANTAFVAPYGENGVYGIWMNSLYHFAIDSQNRITGVGTFFESTSEGYVEFPTIFRFAPDGNPDFSFNNGIGYIRLADARLSKIAIAQNNQVKAVGWTQDPKGDDNLIISLRPLTVTRFLPLISRR